MLAVIGCGNPNRSDDGVGVVVVQRLIERLRRHPVPGVRAFDCGTAGMEVMFAARGADALLIVDASRSGSAPGVVHEVPGEELESLPEPSYTLHDFRWDHALGAGRRIFGDAFPRDVTVWLVEAETTELGLELSPSVDAAADRVYASLLDRVAAYAAGRNHELVRGTVRLKRGSLHLTAELYQRTFNGREGAVVLPEGEQLRVMPVDQAAGGVLVKQRNARGDRALDATDAVRALGWDDWGEVELPVRWDRELGALAVGPPEERAAPAEGERP